VIALRDMPANRDGGFEASLSVPARALSIPDVKSAGHTSDRPQPTPQALTHIAPAPGYQKTAFRVRMAASSFIGQWGTSRVLFGTLTFRRSVRTLRAAVARYQHVLDGLRKRYPELAYLWVVGRSRAGGLHIHCLLATALDVEAGTDWRVVTRPDAPPAELRSALNPAARSLWGLVARLGRPHGFGRMHLAPVHSSPAGVALYLAGNFIGFQGGRLEADRRRRAWGLSRGNPRPPKNSDFTLLTEGNRRHRRRIAGTARDRYGIGDIDGAKRLLGPRWHWTLCRLTYDGPGGPGAAPRAGDRRKSGTPFAAAGSPWAAPAREGVAL